ncbi:MAG: hypothetical protein Kow0068_23020 [Marinilabiliales bacterium]
MDNTNSSTIESLIEKHKENLSAQDYRYYQIDKIVKFSVILDKHENCELCKNYNNKLYKFIIDLPDVINDKIKRVEFNELTQQIAKHLRKNHNYYLTNFHSYTYSFYGMLAGLILGLILIFIFPESKRIFIILSCWFFGLIVGRITGVIKDNKIKKTGFQI